MAEPTPEIKLPVLNDTRSVSTDIPAPRQVIRLNTASECSSPFLTAIGEIAPDLLYLMRVFGANFWPRINGFRAILFIDATNQLMMNRNLRPDSLGIIFILCLVVGTLWTWQDSVIGTHFLEFIMWSLTLGAMIFALLCVVYATLNGMSESTYTPN